MDEPVFGAKVGRLAVEQGSLGYRFAADLLDGDLEKGNRAVEVMDRRGFIHKGIVIHHALYISSELDILGCESAILEGDNLASR